MFFKNILLKNICNEKASSIKSSNKNDVPHVSVFTVRYIPTYDKKSKLDLFCSVAQVVLAVMSIFSPLFYHFYYEYRDLMYSEPVEVFVNRGWAASYSRYFSNSQAVTTENTNNDDGYGIGSPIDCNGIISPIRPGCDRGGKGFGALAKYTFRLENKTKRTIAISDISVDIEKNEEFKPKAILIGFPQGVQENAQYGFNLKSEEGEVGAHELDKGDHLGVPYGESRSISLKEKESETITVAFFVPPARKIDFYLKISFDSTNYSPMFIKSAGDKPFSVVSYPDIDNEYLDSYVYNLEYKKVPCKGQSECFWFLNK